MNITTQGCSSVARYSLSSAFWCVNFRNHSTIIKLRAQRHPGACPDSPFFSDEGTAGDVLQWSGLWPFFRNFKVRKMAKLGVGQKKKPATWVKKAGIMAFLYAIALGSSSSRTKVAEGKLGQFLLIETSYPKF